MKDEDNVQLTSHAVEALEKAMSQDAERRGHEPVRYAHFGSGQKLGDKEAEASDRFDSGGRVHA